MTDQVQETKPKKRSRRRRFGIWMLLSIGFLAGLLLLAGLSLTGRSLTAPDWVAEQAVRRVNKNLPAGRISLGRLALDVDDRGVPHILLRDLGIFDARGAEVARLNDVGARFSLAALLRGELQPEVLRLSGAQMTLRRREDGQFDLSLGTGTGASGTLPGVLDLLDQAFATEPLSRVDQITAEALTITVEDGRSGRIWSVTDGKLQIQPLQDNLDVSLSFEVFNGTEELAQTVIGIRTDRTSSAASLGAAFQNAAAADIALQSPALSFLGLLDAPISGALRADFSTAGELGGLAGTLEIGAGAVQPTPQTRPVRFDAGKAYFRFDPRLNKLLFSEVSVQTGDASASATGHAYLRDFQDGWPSALLAQFSLSNLVIQPKEVFAEPVEFSNGAVDFRLRLNPFSMEIGQVVLAKNGEKLIGNGTVTAAGTGWDVAADLEVNAVAHDRLLALWPVSLVPNTREWIGNHVKAGLLSNIRAAIRLAPERPARVAIGYHFNDANVRYIKTLPEIQGASGYSSIEGNSFSLVVESGTVLAPQGGAIDVAGTTLKIPDTAINPARLEVALHGKSTTTAALSLLNEPPFRIFRKSAYTADITKGRADFAAQIGLDLKQRIEIADIDYQVQAELSNIVSDKLVAGRVLTADRLALRASPKDLVITGPVRLGQVAADMEWVQKLGEGQAGRSTVTGTVALSQTFIDEFGIGLPKGSVSGQGVGEFALILEHEQAPRFSLSSDMNRIGLRIPALGWSKPRNATGKFVAEGRLGQRPAVDRLELSAAGLNASGGSVTLAPDGQFKSASFSRVTTGRWLDAPVTLTSRGRGAVPAVTVRGGSIDIRRTSFGSGSGGGRSGGGPIRLALDRLIVSEGISLTSFQGEFNGAKGFSGRFTGRVNGNSQVSGQTVSESKGIAIRIQSDNAGGVLRDAGVLTTARGGQMDMTLRPQGSDGVYNGRLTVANTRVIGAPALTELLSAISIVGLLDQLGGPGISFTNVQADFRLSPRAITLTKSSAVGPSLGISLDGVYDLTNSRMDMQGVISPVYFLNGIGQIFSRRGEGLFGFTFRLAGSATSPRVRVNPLSILTPGMFREIFRKPPPKPNQ